MSEWREVRVGDKIKVTDYVANGSFATLKKNVKYLNEENYAILLRLVDFHNKWKGNFVYVDKNSYEFLKKTKVYPNDIIISNVGVNVGTVFKAPNLNKPMTLGPNSILLKCSNEIINKYIYYYFISRIGQNKIFSIVTGSAQPKFNKTDFRNLRIKLPPLPIQKKSLIFYQ
jgi:type I restriction enzyme S subunit